MALLIILFLIFSWQPLQTSLTSTSVARSNRAPLIITSEAFTSHKPLGYHPESPDRVTACIKELRTMDNCVFKSPSAETHLANYKFSLEIIRRAHNTKYVDHVERMCNKNAPFLSPYDEDTYISNSTYHQCILAQSAWIDGVNAVVNDNRTSFAITRPPGHHACTAKSMGFCVFNFAVGAALYAIDYLHLDRIAILDFDVHFGNGVAEMISTKSKIRYCSLHEDGLFPYGQGRADDKGRLGNILNVPLKGGTKWPAYREALTTKAIPFLQSYNPDLVIVCAGYDAMASDELSTMQFYPKDYGELAKVIRDAFGSAVLLGLEGGYNVRDLPLAVRATLEAFVDQV